MSETQPTRVEPEVVDVADNATDATPDAPGATTHADAAASPEARPAPLEPLTPRIGTIVWGCILLVVGVIAIAASQLDFGDLAPAVIVWAVIGFGALLVVAGGTTAIVRAVTRSRRRAD